MKVSGEIIREVLNHQNKVGSTLFGAINQGGLGTSQSPLSVCDPLKRHSLYFQFTFLTHSLFSTVPFRFFVIQQPKQHTY